MSNSSSTFRTDGLVRVYVNAGETIYIGSSAQGIYGGQTVIVSPSGVSTTNSSTAGIGLISNYSQESIGPIAGGYTPYKITATESGVWSVFFKGSTSNTSAPSNPVVSNVNWPTTTVGGITGDRSGDIAAFDVSVSTSASAATASNFIKGRAYLNVFGGSLWDYYGVFRGKFHVLTNDGYNYEVNANGLAGHAFVFFSNNKGYKQANGTASYLSENSTSTAKLHDPRLLDNATANDITHKLFFNPPASDLPLNVQVPIRSNNGTSGDLGTAGTTWFRTTPVLPSISDFTFSGIEGTPGLAGTAPLGGFIGFTSNQIGTYTINIDVDNNGVDAGDVTLTGSSKADTNLIYWNGLDGAGVKVPSGTIINASAIKVTLKAGEVHFPFIDVENNPGGMIITRQEDGDQTVYWNDVNIQYDAGGGAGADTEPVPIVQLAGTSSATNGHKFGTTSYRSNDFGNDKGLDTWTYLLSNTISSGVAIQLREADLQVVSVVSNKTAPASYCIGETVTYTIQYKNNGPSSVSGAKIAFDFPSAFTLTSVPTYTSTGTVVITQDPTTSTKVSAVVDMSNQATITLTVTGIVNAQPTGGILATTASILRPADVYDPDASNPDLLPPTDPLLECNAGTVGCNNIVNHSATIPLSNITIAPTSASKSEGNTPGTTTDMTFTVSLSTPNNTCPVTVDYAIVFGLTNALDYDFTSNPQSGTLTFAPGETSKIITLKVKQDLMVEANETFSVVLTNPSSGGQITTASATGTIANDDEIFQIEITKADGTEGGANASFTFTFPFGESFDVDTPIPYTLKGTATGSGTDYTAAGTAGTIIMPAGSNSVTLDLTVNNDALTEGSETVIITPGTISNVYNPSVTVITPVPVVTITDNDPATLTISGAAITEGDSGSQILSFNVTLSNATGSSFDIDYATADGTALAGEDYVAKTGTLTFTGTALTQTITIEVNGDLKIEQNEAFTIALSSLSNTFGGQLTVVGSPATGTITDNDNIDANKVITITPSNGQELGPASAVFTFSFPAGVSADQPTTIFFGLTGTAGTADYTGTVPSITIAAGANSGTLSLAVLGDDILEGPESVIITTTSVSNSTYSTIVVNNSPQTLSIIDDDAANIITGPVTVTEGNNGLTNMNFNVQLDKATGSGFTIDYTISNVTAIAGEDYTTSSGLFTGTLTFSGVPETQQITVQVIGDQKIEANETLTLTLGTPSNTFGNLLAVQNSPATGTITDDDNDPLNKIITITKANGYEGVAGSEASFTFSLPNGVTVSTDTEISYTLSGTTTGNGASGADYTGSYVGTIRILAGQNSTTLALPVLDDLVLEGDETVIVTVNGTSNPSFDPFTVSNSGLSLLIVENDNTILLSSPPVIIEGNSGTTFARFTVSIDLATGGPFNIQYATSDGTAIAGEDYEPQTGTVFFDGTAGEQRFIYIEVNGDLKIEADETFTVTLHTLSNTFGGNLLIGPPVTMTITDDDDIPANKIIIISKIDGAEPGTDGTFTLSFPTGITSGAATTVNYVLSGTAQGGGIDYTDTELSPIIIPAGQNSVTISMIDVADDYIIEGAESVLMTISSVTNSSYTGFAGNTPVALDIIDNDNTSLNNVITLSKESDGAEPGTQAQFRVSFPTAPNLITASVPTTVNYTISGTALNGVDYTSLSGTVVIPVGSNSALINVLVISDQIIEALEKVEITLTNASNSISTLTVGPGMVSADIADDDNVPANNTITLSKVLDGSEPGTDAQFKVSFPTGITSSVDTYVIYSIDGSGTASPGTDYTALTGTVTIPAGANSAFIDIDVIDDLVIEKSETILLALISANNSISTLTVQPLNLVGVSIGDNDNSPANNIITLSGISNAAEPGTNGIFRISYPAGITSSEATIVNYVISGNTINGTDYSTISLSATIPANSNSVDVNIIVVNDQIIESSETIGLALTLADNASFDPTVNGALVEINLADDDNAPANNRIILTAVNNGSEPAVAGQFTVGFPAGITSSEPTIVNYKISGSATSGIDYSALTGTVTIPANSGPVPINIAVLDDNIIEGTETVEITLDNATNSIISSLATLPSSPVSINIADNENNDPADNIISLTNTDGSEPGSNPTFVLSYPAGITSSKNTQITYTVGTGGTAISGTDYSAMSGTATILAGNNFATIAVPVIDDQIIELTETVQITINSANNTVSTLTWTPTGALSTNIADNDNNPANNTITLSKVRDGSEPGTSVQFALSFPAGITSSAATSVSYTIGGTATSGTDYTAPLTTVVIPANTNSLLINITVIDDFVIESSETLSLLLTAATNPNASMAISPNGSAVVASITDNDNSASNNTISLSLLRNGTEGGDNPQFKVSFPIGYSSSEPTTISYAPTGVNTATLNVDYTVPLSTITIPAFANSAIIEIPLTSDLILEPTENFQLVLTGASNSVATGLTYQTTPESADILDDDNTASNNVVSITKITDGVEAGTPAVFNVGFPGGYSTSVPTTVNYIVSGGTAADGTDYTITGQAIIPAGSGSVNFDVTLINDQILEATETVQLSLVDATNSIFTPITVNPAPAIANIGDDDSNVAANKEITIVTNDGSEVTPPGIQNPGIFTFQFPSGFTASAPTTINYVLTGTAGGNGTDYTGAVGETVIIPAGENGVSISFPINDDVIVENSETIILTTGVVSNAQVSGISVANSPATVTLTDNDAATLSVNNVTVIEGNSGDTEVEFTVTLDKATGGSFSINYSTGDGSATVADNDYNAQAATTLSFAGNAGETVRFIVHVNGDQKIESTEIFNVNFSNLSNTFNGRLTMPVPTATGTITNDDSGTIAITSTPGSEANPDPSGASFTFSFPSGVSSDQPTTIFFGLSVGSTATITDDYIFPGLTGSVTIPAGANSASITLPVVNDAVLESTETITLTVGSVVNPYGITVTTPTATATILDNDAASVSLSTPGTVNENAGTATFTVTLTGNVQETFTVTYGTSNGTASTPADYAGVVGGTVSFPAGSVSGATQLFTVPINDDNLLEAGETFSATLSSITGLTTIATASAQTTITDNDAATLAISGPANVDEDAGTATFTLTLTGNIQDAFNVNYATENGTAIQPGDYTPGSNTFTFPAGSVSGAAQTFTVAIQDDKFLEANETFSATLSGITGGLVTIATPALTTTITDNDAAGVSISTPATVSEATGMATFTVTLTGNSQAGFSVDYATSNGAATQPGDYTQTTGTLIFPAGSVSGAFQIFQVPLISDGITEPGENFRASLSNMTGGLVTISTGTATTTITDSDAAGVSITAPATVNEAAGTATFTVTLTGTIQDAVTISYATSNISTQANDHANTSGTVTFPAGSVGGTTQPITVNIINDIIAEPAETFSVTLSNITNPQVSMGTASASTTINDDDAASVSLATDPTVSEAAGTATFTVTLTGGVQDAFTIDYATANGTAVAPGDYTALSTGSVTFPAGSVSGAARTFTVAILDDNLREPVETFSAAISNITGGIATIATGTGTTTITDNDAASVAISTAPTVNENGTATFTVTLSGNVQQAFSVNYTTVNGTAIAPGDYTQTPGTITFPAGSQDGEFRTFTVPIFDDQLAEGNENFSASLSGITGALTTIATTTAATTIVDNDVTSVSISTLPSVNETAGTAIFTVTLSGGIQDPVTVDYATSNGTAQAPGDYTATTGTVAFLAGSVSGSIQTFTVPILNDFIRESDETFSATLGTITGLATMGTSTATTAITDNDVASVALSTPLTVNEANGTAAFTVTLTGNVQEAFTVNYNTTDGSANAPGDYTAQTNGTVSFPAGSPGGSTQTFLVTINNDNLVETNETFSATLNGITGLTTITNASATATTTIVDNDAASIAISSPAPVLESAGTANFTVTLTGDVQQAFTVNYTTSNGTATAPGDYAANTAGTITFPANSSTGTTRTISIPVVDDNVVESGETFGVTLTGVSGPATISTPAATATITDNDAASVALSTISPVSEALGTATFTVTLTGNVQEAFTLNFITEDGSAKQPADYTNTSGSVTFPAGSVSGATETFTVAIQDDQIVESNEPFSARLTAITGLTTIATPTATAIITDNDAATVSISTSASFNENGTAIFNVTLNGSVQEPVTVTYSTTNGTAIASGDYISQTGSVTFPAGSANGAVQTITVDIEDDILTEPSETFSVSLGNITSGLATISATATAMTTIIDNDAASLAISTVPTINENGTATFTVTLNGAIQDAVSVDYATANITAIAPGDYPASSGTINLQGGSLNGSTRTFTVAIQDDNVIESAETFRGVLSNITGLATIGTNTATTTITDNDAAILAVTVVSHGAEPGTDVQYKVSFPAGFSSTEATTVTFSASGTATLGSDYTAFANTVLIPAGAEFALIDVDVLDDQRIEQTEQLNVVLISAASASFTHAVQATPANANISDNDLAPITLSLVSNGAEPSSDIRFRIGLPAGVNTSEATTITYTIGGTATAGTDYTALNGTATIAAGQNEVFINVDVIDDQKIEVTENVELALTSALSTNFTYTVLPASAVSANIIDNDMASANVVLTKVRNGAEPGTDAQFKVSLLGGVTSTQDVTVNYSFNGSAFNSIDYSTLPGSVVIPAGSIEALINVDVLNDQFVENTETVALTLTRASSTNFNIPFSTTMVSADILDNDLMGVSLSRNLHGAESSNNAAFKVSFPAGVISTEATVVTYTVAGTATAGADYTAVTGTVTIPAGANSALIDVVVLDDNLIETTEQVSLTMTNAASASFTYSVDPSAVSADIADNDMNSLTLRWVSHGGEPGTAARFKVSFPGGTTSSEDITVNYTIGGNASAGSDYTPLSGKVLIPAGLNEATIDVPVIDDGIIESVETVTVTLTSAASTSFAYNVLPSAAISADIIDDDNNPVTLSRVVHAAEPGTNGQFKVSLPPGLTSNEAITVNYLIGGTAKGGNDYKTLSGVIIIPAGTTQTFIDVEVTNDLLIEVTETVELRLTSASSTNYTLAVASGTPVSLNISDDDNIAASSNIVLTKILDGAEPLTNARFKVSFQNPGLSSSEPIKILYTVSGDAVNGTDYSSLNGSVTIPSGSKEAFIDIEVIDDMIIEKTENLTLTLISASSANTTIPVQVEPVTAIINDNDQVVLTLSNPSVTEGDNGTATLTFNAILSTEMPGGFAISYNTSDGTATVADKDYIAVNGTWNFAGRAGETHSVNVTVNGDRKIERDEIFNLTLVAPTTLDGRLVIIESPAIGTILDDDNTNENKIVTITKTDGAEGAYNGSITFSLPLAITMDSPTMIPFTFAGTAFSGQDYIPLNTNPLVIPAGVNAITIPIPVRDDAIMEGTENIRILPGIASNTRYEGIIVADPIPLVNITDNDFSFLTINSMAIQEGNAGGTLLTFKVTLSGATATPFILDFTSKDNTATLINKDYNLKTGSLIFNGTAGEVHTIGIWINSDINVENDENYRVILNGLSKTFGGALRIGAAPGVGTIVNDDVEPVGNEDIIVTDEDKAVTSNIIANDRDYDGSMDPAGITIVTMPKHGTLKTNLDGTVTYIPIPDYNGTDGFTYTGKDNTGIVTGETKVSIVVRPVNDPPKAEGEMFYVLKDGSLNATVATNDSDSDGDELSFKVVTTPGNGRLSSFNLADGSFTYVPNKGYTGIDRFTYQACDPAGLCSSAEVTLYVQPKVIVTLSPANSIITEGDVLTITAQITEPLYQDVEITIDYSGAAENDLDYTREGDIFKMVIPAGKLTTRQKITIKSKKDFLKEGDELLGVVIKTATPIDFVTIGNGSDIVIKDIYPKDKEIGPEENPDINPDPYASPNGDGVGNEKFIIHNIERYPENEVILYNRWGSKVYQIKGYDNRDSAFSGVANTGLLSNQNAVLVDGVYFFIIHTKDKTGVAKINKGYVILKR